MHVKYIYFLLPRDYSKVLETISDFKSKLKSPAALENGRFSMRCDRNNSVGIMYSPFWPRILFFFPLWRFKNISYTIYLYTLYTYILYTSHNSILYSHTYLYHDETANNNKINDLTISSTNIIILNLCSRIIYR